MVAKTYQSLPQIGEPFYQNGKKYVKVRTAQGFEKSVRWYTEAEYAKYYPNDAATVRKTLRESLGFTADSVTIFKGNTYPLISWFKEAKARYSPKFGWYFPTDVAVPSEIPAGLEAVELYWADIADNDETLKNDDLIKAHIESLVFEECPSKFQGEVGEKITFIGECIKTYSMSGYYGVSTMHTFQDEDGNLYVWTTASKCLEEGVTYQVTGKIKDHKLYRNQEETIMTRCTVKAVKC